MKSIIISIALFLIILPKGMSQVVISGGLYFNPAGRQVWVTKIGGEKIDRALLWKVSKDSIFILPTAKKTVTPEDSLLEQIRFHYTEIDKLTTKKNRPGITGLWSGVIIGSISGVIINIATYQDVESSLVTLDKSDTNVISGFLGAVVGAVGGVAVAAVAKKNWEISGNKNKYDDIILDLDKRAYWNQSTRPKKIN